MSAGAGDEPPLRILFAVDSTFPTLGGAENQALKLAAALKERGVCVEFIAPRVLPSQKLHESYKGFSVTRIPYPYVRVLGSLVLLFSTMRYIRLNASRFDAIHVHITHLLAAAAGFVRRQSGLPVTTKISGFYEFEGGVLDRSKRYQPLNFIIRQGLKHVDFVQTISTQTREKLLDSGFRDEQIQFIPNGVDICDVVPKGPEYSALRIGYCGRLREVKGVHVLLDGFAALKSRYPQQPLTLAIAGAGTSQAAMQQQAEQLGISADIEWLGMIEDTRSFFSSIDIYVQPSYAEGLPNSVMEAMVAQRPVVATDIGGNRDLVSHDQTGLLFAPGDTEAMVSALSRLIEQPALSERLAQAGRVCVAHQYSFQSVTRQLMDLYRAQ